MKITFSGTVAVLDPELVVALPAGTKAVALRFDREQRLVGIQARAGNDQVPGFRVLRPVFVRKNGQRWDTGEKAVWCAAFCRHYSMMSTASVSVAWDEAHGMFVGRC